MNCRSHGLFMHGIRGDRAGECLFRGESSAVVFGEIYAVGDSAQKPDRGGRDDADRQKQHRPGDHVVIQRQECGHGQQRRQGDRVQSRHGDHHRQSSQRDDGQLFDKSETCRPILSGQYRIYASKEI